MCVYIICGHIDRSVNNYNINSIHRSHHYDVTYNTRSFRLCVPMIYSYYYWRPLYDHLILNAVSNNGYNIVSCGDVDFVFEPTRFSARYFFFSKLYNDVHAVYSPPSPGMTNIAHDVVQYPPPKRLLLAYTTRSQRYIRIFTRPNVVEFSPVRVDQFRHSTFRLRRLYSVYVDLSKLLRVQKKL